MIRDDATDFNLPPECFETSIMKSVFMGTPALAVPYLEKLRQHTDLCAVISRADQIAKRGHKMMASPVKEAALKLGIEILTPPHWKDPQLLEIVRSWSADLAVVVAYGRLLPKTLIDLFPKGVINIHFSLLPQLRGAAPMQHALLNGLQKTGVTSFYIEEGLDSGPCLVQKEIPIDAAETISTLENKLIALGLNVLEETLQGIKSGTLQAAPQQGAVTLAPPLQKQDYAIDWNRPAIFIQRQVRALAKLGAFTFLPNGKRLLILNADCMNEASSQTPGTVLALAKGKGIVVQCQDQPLLLTEIKPEGKNAMSAWAWAQGKAIAIGAQLNSSTPQA